VWRFIYRSNVKFKKVLLMKIVRVALIAMIIMVFASCASHQKSANTEMSDAQPVNIDPWEGFNRKVYAFNSTLDRWFLKPVAKGYDFLLPDFVQAGVGNFFSNIGEVGNIGNDILQWKWKQASIDSGRLLVNSTLGVAGLFDVASNIGLPQDDGEDMGQTFEAWGIKRGPYLVLPIFGPSSLREAFARPFDALMDPVNYVDDDTTLVALNVTRIVHGRYRLFDLEETIEGAADEYMFVSASYLPRTESLHTDGLIESGFKDEFGSADFKACLTPHEPYHCV